MFWGNAIRHKHKAENLTKKLSVSVLVPTYKRAHLLSYVLAALEKQSYKDFDVVVILKPSKDKTEEIIEKFKKSLRIKMIVQEKGFVIDALNLGLENVSGDITVFLDDDAIPFPDWLQNLVETYGLPNVGGAAGKVMPAFLNERNMVLVDGKGSGIISDRKPFLDDIGRKIWGCPIEGLEDYFVYISKAGLVDYKFSIKNLANQRITKSLLGMGANMSVLTEAIKGFSFPNSWILGWGFEQFLAWHVWKKGYSLFYNPEAKVHHLVHGQTLSRNIVDFRKQLLREAEVQLLFYRLYGLEKDLSVMHRISWIIFRTLFILKHAQSLREAFILLKGMLIGNIIGCKLLVSNKFGLRYDPLFELEATLGKGQ
jgi:glycosyltransferase involved in cell wall biosynthesis